MPTFFRKSELTENQKSNWDKMIEKYKAIQANNINHDISEMTNEEKQKQMKVLKCSENEFVDKYTRISSVFSQPGHEKSALFHRLLEGKKALKYAPPTSYSYPWYSVIEDNINHELHMGEEINNYVKSENKSDVIIINQTYWKVLEVISSKEILITYGQWEKLGYVWKLEMKKISCEDSTSFICAWHNPELQRITTMSQLELEQRWHVEKKYSVIKLVLDDMFAEKEQKEYIEKNGEGYGSGLFQNAISQGKYLLEERRKNKLSDYPTEEEIVLETKKYIKHYLDRDITVDNGQLYKTIWTLTKIAPIDNIDIYLE